MDTKDDALQLMVNLLWIRRLLEAALLNPGAVYVARPIDGSVSHLLDDELGAPPRTNTGPHATAWRAAQAQAVVEAHFTITRAMAR